jgi:hypothetical protein
MPSSASMLRGLTVCITALGHVARNNSTLV